ncbi:amidohydrolase family protein, partial [Algoriphagus sp.]
TSINSDSAELIRHLYHEAAKTQRYGGMTDDEALAMITINPAKQLGIDDKVGSLEEGKQADIVIFEGHPLSSYAVPQMTFVDGVKYFDIKEDKDDQRQQVSATEMVEPIMLTEENHRCMQDTEHLFETANALFSLHNH